MGGDKAAVAIGPQVFGGVEAKRPRITQGTGLGGRLARGAVAGPDGLGCILQHLQAVLLGKVQQLAHGGHLAVQMNRQDGPGARGEGSLEQGRIEVKVAGVDVHQHGAGPHVLDGLEGGDKGKGRGDHLIPRPQAHGPQGDDEGIGAGAAGDHVGDAQVGGQLLLQGGDLGPPHEGPRGQHAGQGGVNLAFQFQILTFKVKNGYHSKHLLHSLVHVLSP